MLNPPTLRPHRPIEVFSKRSKSPKRSVWKQPPMARFTGLPSLYPFLAPPRPKYIKRVSLLRTANQNPCQAAGRRCTPYIPTRRLIMTSTYPHHPAYPDTDILTPRLILTPNAQTFYEHQRKSLEFHRKSMKIKSTKDNYNLWDSERTHRKSSEIYESQCKSTKIHRNPQTIHEIQREAINNCENPWNFYENV